jgi:hypothetical protein
MLRAAGLLAMGAFLLQAVPGKPVRVSDGASYAADGTMQLPERYREWVFLSSGVDMSYSSDARDDGHSMFNNVFVNPEAYLRYQGSGHWPEGTVLVLENRMAEAGDRRDALLKSGKVQTTEVMGVEVHVLDSAHWKATNSNAKTDGWAFYEFGTGKVGKIVARPATCYSCHEQHAAVDTTFVQFYPTLQPVAEMHGTFSAGYLKDIRVK